jgi:hypothetical protein
VLGYRCCRWFHLVLLLFLFIFIPPTTRHSPERARVRRAHPLAVPRGVFSLKNKNQGAGSVMSSLRLVKRKKRGMKN